MFNWTKRCEILIDLSINLNSISILFDLKKPNRKVNIHVNLKIHRDSPFLKYNFKIFKRRVIFYDIHDFSFFFIR